VCVALEASTTVGFVARSSIQHSVPHSMSSFENLTQAIFLFLFLEL
jgi:hypothetical protein